MPNSSKTHSVNCRFTPILQPSHEAMARHGGLTCRLCSGPLGLLWSCRPAGFGSIRSVILRCACRCGGIRLGSRRFASRNGRQARHWSHGPVLQSNPVMSAFSLGTLCARSCHHSVFFASLSPLRLGTSEQLREKCRLLGTVLT